MTCLKRRLYSPVFVILLLSSLAPCTAQIAITCPAFVTSGVGYQYNITGPWKAGSTLQICITGGTIFNTDSTCITGNSISFVRVNWNDQNKGGNILVTSDSATASIKVSITKALQGGSIDSSSHLQAVFADHIPAAIHCSAASGGNCSPSYRYQWQESYDMMSWTDITGAQEQNLSFSTPGNQIIYYRRKVVEVASGSIAFSNEATVDGN